MKQEIFALEYQQGKEEGNFHYNMVFDKKYDHELMTYGYYPITVITGNVASNRSFLDLQSKLSSKNASVQEVVSEVYNWAARHQDIWTR